VIRAAGCRAQPTGLGNGPSGWPSRNMRLLALSTDLSWRRHCPLQPGSAGGPRNLRP
jgi:hypothetical protein